MKKIIFSLFLLGNLAFCDNDNTYHGVIVDEGQKGEIFGQLGVIDGTEAFGDPYVTRNTSGGCIKKAADCGQFFNNAVNTWSQRTESELDQLEKRWKETNKALDAVVDIARELPIAHSQILNAEADKLNKLKEINANLEKAVNIEETTAHININNSKASLSQ